MNSCFNRMNGRERNARAFNGTHAPTRAGAKLIDFYYSN